MKYKSKGRLFFSEELFNGTFYLVEYDDKDPRFDNPESPVIVIKGKEKVQKLPLIPEEYKLKDFRFCLSCDMLFEYNAKKLEKYNMSLKCIHQNFDKLLEIETFNNAKEFYDIMDVLCEGLK